MIQRMCRLLFLLMNPFGYFFKPLGGHAGGGGERNSLVLSVPSALRGMVPRLCISRGRNTSVRAGEYFDLMGLVIGHGAPYLGGGMFSCRSEEHVSEITSIVEGMGYRALPGSAPVKKRMTEKELIIVASAMHFNRRKTP